MTDTETEAATDTESEKSIGVIGVLAESFANAFRGKRKQESTSNPKPEPKSTPTPTSTSIAAFETQSASENPFSGPAVQTNSDSKKKQRSNKPAQSEISKRIRSKQTSSDDEEGGEPKMTPTTPKKLVRNSGQVKEKKFEKINPKSVLIEVNRMININELTMDATVFLIDEYIFNSEAGYIKTIHQVLVPLKNKHRKMFILDKQQFAINEPKGEIKVDMSNVTFVFVNNARVVGNKSDFLISDPEYEEFSKTFKDRGFKLVEISIKNAIRVYLSEESATIQAQGISDNFKNIKINPLESRIIDNSFYLNIFESIAKSRIERIQSENLTQNVGIENFESQLTPFNTSYYTLSVNKQNASKKNYRILDIESSNISNIFASQYLKGNESKIKDSIEFLFALIHIWSDTDVKKDFKYRLDKTFGLFKEESFNMFTMDIGEFFIFKKSVNAELKEILYYISLSISLWVAECLKVMAFESEMFTILMKKKMDMVLFTYENESKAIQTKYSNNWFYKSTDALLKGRIANTNNPYRLFIEGYRGFGRVGLIDPKLKDYQFFVTNKVGINDVFYFYQQKENFIKKAKLLQIYNFLCIEGFANISINSKEIKLIHSLNALIVLDYEKLVKTIAMGCELWYVISMIYLYIFKNRDTHKFQKFNYEGKTENELDIYKKMPVYDDDTYKKVTSSFVAIRDDSIEVVNFADVNETISQYPQTEFVGSINSIRHSFQNLENMETRMLFMIAFYLSQRGEFEGDVKREMFQLLEGSTKMVGNNAGDSLLRKRLIEYIENPALDTRLDPQRNENMRSYIHMLHTFDGGFVGVEEFDYERTLRNVRRKRIAKGYAKVIGSVLAAGAAAYFSTQFIDYKSYAKDMLQSFGPIGQEFVDPGFFYTSLHANPENIHKNEQNRLKDFTLGGVEYDVLYDPVDGNVMGATYVSGGTERYITPDEPSTSGIFQFVDTYNSGRFFKSSRSVLPNFISLTDDQKRDMADSQRPEAQARARRIKAFFDQYNSGNGESLFGDETYGAQQLYNDMYGSGAQNFRGEPGSPEWFQKLVFRILELAFSGMATSAEEINNLLRIWAQEREVIIGMIGNDAFLEKLTSTVFKAVMEKIQTMINEGSAGSLLFLSENLVILKAFIGALKLEGVEMPQGPAYEWLNDCSGFNMIDGSCPFPGYENFFGTPGQVVSFVKPDGTFKHPDLNGETSLYYEENRAFFDSHASEFLEMSVVTFVREKEYILNNDIYLVNPKPHKRWRVKRTEGPDLLGGINEIIGAEEKGEGSGDESVAGRIFGYKIVEEEVFNGNERENSGESEASFGGLIDEIIRIFWNDPYSEKLILALDVLVKVALNSHSFIIISKILESEKFKGKTSLVSALLSATSSSGQKIPIFGSPKVAVKMEKGMGAASVLGDITGNDTELGKRNPEAKSLMLKEIEASREAVTSSDSYKGRISKMSQMKTSQREIKNVVQNTDITTNGALSALFEGENSERIKNKGNKYADHLVKAKVLSKVEEIFGQEEYRVTPEVASAITMVMPAIDKKVPNCKSPNDWARSLFGGDVVDTTVCMLGISETIKNVNQEDGSENLVGTMTVLNDLVSKRSASFPEKSVLQVLSESPGVQRSADYMITEGILPAMKTLVDNAASDKQAPINKQVSEIQEVVDLYSQLRKEFQPIVGSDVFSSGWVNEVTEKGLFHTNWLGGNTKVTFGDYCAKYNPASGPIGGNAKVLSELNMRSSMTPAEIKSLDDEKQGLLSTVKYDNQEGIYEVTKEDDFQSKFNRLGKHAMEIFGSNPMAMRDSFAQRQNEMGIIGLSYMIMSSGMPVDDDIVEQYLDPRTFGSESALMLTGKGPASVVYNTVRYSMIVSGGSSKMSSDSRTWRDVLVIKTDKNGKRKIIDTSKKPGDVGDVKRVPVIISKNLKNNNKGRLINPPKGDAYRASYPKLHALVNGADYYYPERVLAEFFNNDNSGDRKLVIPEMHEAVFSLMIPSANTESAIGALATNTQRSVYDDFANIMSIATDIKEGRFDTGLTEDVRMVRERVLNWYERSFPGGTKIVRSAFDVLALNLASTKPADLDTISKKVNALLILDSMEAAPDSVVNAATSLASNIYYLNFKPSDSDEVIRTFSGAPAVLDVLKKFRSTPSFPGDVLVGLIDSLPPKQASSLFLSSVGTIVKKDDLMSDLFSKTGFWKNYAHFKPQLLEMNESYSKQMVSRVEGFFSDAMSVGIKLNENTISNAGAQILEVVKETISLTTNIPESLLGGGNDKLAFGTKTPRGGNREAKVVDLLKGLSGMPKRFDGLGITERHAMRDLSKKICKLQNDLEYDPHNFQTAIHYIEFGKGGIGVKDYGVYTLLTLIEQGISDFSRVPSSDLGVYSSILTMSKKLRDHMEEQGFDDGFIFNSAVQIMGSLRELVRRGVTDKNILSSVAMLNSVVYNRSETGIKLGHVETEREFQWLNSCVSGNIDASDCIYPGKPGYVLGPGMDEYNSHALMAEMKVIAGTPEVFVKKLSNYGYVTVDNYLGVVSDKDTQLFLRASASSYLSNPQAMVATSAFYTELASKMIRVYGGEDFRRLDVDFLSVNDNFVSKKSLAFRKLVMPLFSGMMDREAWFDALIELNENEELVNHGSVMGEILITAIETKLVPMLKTVLTNSASPKIDAEDLRMIKEINILYQRLLSNAGSEMNNALKKDESIGVRMVDFSGLLLEQSSSSRVSSMLNDFEISKILKDLKDGGNTSPDVTILSKMFEGIEAPGNFMNAIDILGFENSRYLVGYSLMKGWGDHLSWLYDAKSGLNNGSTMPMAINSSNERIQALIGLASQRISNLSAATVNYNLNDYRKRKEGEFKENLEMGPVYYRYKNRGVGQIPVAAQAILEYPVDIGDLKIKPETNPSLERREIKNNMDLLVSQVYDYPLQVRPGSYHADRETYDLLKSVFPDRKGAINKVSEFVLSEGVEACFDSLDFLFGGQPRSLREMSKLVKDAIELDSSEEPLQVNAKLKIFDYILNTGIRALEYQDPASRGGPEIEFWSSVANLADNLRLDTSVMAQSDMRISNGLVAGEMAKRFNSENLDIHSVGRITRKQEIVVQSVRGGKVTNFDSELRLFEVYGAENLECKNYKEVMERMEETIHGIYPSELPKGDVASLINSISEPVMSGDKQGHDYLSGSRMYLFAKKVFDDGINRPSSMRVVVSELERIANSDLNSRPSPGKLKMVMDKLKQPISIILQGKNDIASLVTKFSWVRLAKKIFGDERVPESMYVDGYWTKGIKSEMTSLLDMRDQIPGIHNKQLKTLVTDPLFAEYIIPNITDRQIEAELEDVADFSFGPRDEPKNFNITKFVYSYEKAVTSDREVASRLIKGANSQISALYILAKSVETMDLSYYQTAVSYMKSESSGSNQYSRVFESIDKELNKDVDGALLNSARSNTGFKDMNSRGYRMVFSSKKRYMLSDFGELGEDETSVKTKLQTMKSEPDMGNARGGNEVHISVVNLLGYMKKHSFDDVRRGASEPSTKGMQHLANLEEMELEALRGLTEDVNGVPAGEVPNQPTIQDFASFSDNNALSLSDYAEKKRKFLEFYIHPEYLPAQYANFMKSIKDMERGGVLGLTPHAKSSLRGFAMNILGGEYSTPSAPDLKTMPIQNVILINEIERDTGKDILGGRLSSEMPYLISEASSDGQSLRYLLSEDNVMRALDQGTVEMIGRLKIDNKKELKQVSGEIERRVLGTRAPGDLSRMFQLSESPVVLLGVQTTFSENPFEYVDWLGSGNMDVVNKLVSRVEQGMTSDPFERAVVGLHKSLIGENDKVIELYGNNRVGSFLKLRGLLETGIEPKYLDSKLFGAKQQFTSTDRFLKKMIFDDRSVTVPLETMGEVRRVLAEIYPEYDGNLVGAMRLLKGKSYKVDYEFVNAFLTAVGHLGEYRDEISVASQIREINDIILGSGDARAFLKGRFENVIVETLRVSSTSQQKQGNNKRADSNMTRAYLQFEIGRMHEILNGDGGSSGAAVDKNSFFKSEEYIKYLDSSAEIGPVTAFINSFVNIDANVYVYRDFFSDDTASFIWKRGASGGDLDPLNTIPNSYEFKLKASELYPATITDDVLLSVVQKTNSRMAVRVLQSRHSNPKDRNEYRNWFNSNRRINSGDNRIKAAFEADRDIHIKLYGLHDNVSSEEGVLRFLETPVSVGYKIFQGEKNKEGERDQHMTNEDIKREMGISENANTKPLTNEDIIEQALSQKEGFMPFKDDLLPSYIISSMEAVVEEKREPTGMLSAFLNDQNVPMINKVIKLWDLVNNGETIYKNIVSLNAVNTVEFLKQNAFSRSVVLRKLISRLPSDMKETEKLSYEDVSNIAYVAVLANKIGSYGSVRNEFPEWVHDIVDKNASLFSLNFPGKKSDYYYLKKHPTDSFVKSRLKNVDEFIGGQLKKHIGTFKLEGGEWRKEEQRAKYEMVMKYGPDELLNFWKSSTDPESIKRIVAILLYNGYYYDMKKDYDDRNAKGAKSADKGESPVKTFDGYLKDLMGFKDVSAYFGFSTHNEDISFAQNQPTPKRPRTMDLSKEVKEEAEAAKAVHPVVQRRVLFEKVVVPKVDENASKQRQQQQQKKPASQEKGWNYFTQPGTNRQFEVETLESVGRAMVPGNIVMPYSREYNLEGRQGVESYTVNDVVKKILAAITDNTLLTEESRNAIIDLDLFLDGILGTNMNSQLNAFATHPDPLLYAHLMTKMLSGPPAVADDLRRNGYSLIESLLLGNIRDSDIVKTLSPKVRLRQRLPNPRHSLYNSAVFDAEYPPITQNSNAGIWGEVKEFESVAGSWVVQGKRITNAGANLVKEYLDLTPDNRQLGLQDKLEASSRLVNVLGSGSVKPGEMSDFLKIHHRKMKDGMDSSTPPRAKLYIAEATFSGVIHAMANLGFRGTNLEQKRELLEFVISNREDFAPFSRELLQTLDFINTRDESSNLRPIGLYVLNLISMRMLPEDFRANQKVGTGVMAEFNELLGMSFGNGNGNGNENKKMNGKEMGDMISGLLGGGGTKETRKQKRDELRADPLRVYRSLMELDTEDAMKLIDSIDNNELKYVLKKSNYPGHDLARELNYRFVSLDSERRNKMAGNVNGEWVGHGDTEGEFVGYRSSVPYPILINYGKQHSYYRMIDGKLQEGIGDILFILNTVLNEIIKERCVIIAKSKNQEQQEQQQQQEIRFSVVGCNVYELTYHEEIFYTMAESYGQGAELIIPSLNSDKTFKDIFSVDYDMIDPEVNNVPFVYLGGDGDNSYYLETGPQLYSQFSDLL